MAVTDCQWTAADSGVLSEGCWTHPSAVRH